jgi:hypothetical protein
MNFRELARDELLLKSGKEGDSVLEKVACLTLE